MKLPKIMIFVFLAFCISFNSRSQESQSILNSINASLSYTSDLWGNTTGGVEKGIKYLDNIDVESSFKLLESTFFLYGIINNGESISQLSGDIQAVSNIEAENSRYIYEAWINTPIYEANTSLLIGLYDLNSEFDVIKTAGLFMNSSHGIGSEYSSTGEEGPSIFPLTSFAARIKFIPTSNIVVKGAFLDASPFDPNLNFRSSLFLGARKGGLFAAEVTLLKPLTVNKSRLDRGINEESPFRFVIGAWKYTQHRVGWNDNSESDHGAYAIFESLLYQERKDATQGLTAFVRLGIGNGEINRFKSYAGWGLAYSGLFNGRDSDQFGIAFALPINSDSYIEAEKQFNNDYSKSEFVTEITYLVSANDHLSFQFDTQYIRNPNQAPNLNNALVIGLRSSVSF